MTENICEFHILLAIRKCFLLELSFNAHHYETSVTDTNIFALIDFIIMHYGVWSMENLQIFAVVPIDLL